MKIYPRRGVEVYTNQNNCIAIKNTSLKGDEDVVEIHPDYVDEVIAGLRREKEEFISLGLKPGVPELDDEADT